MTDNNLNNGFVETKNLAPLQNKTDWVETTLVEVVKTKIEKLTLNNYMFLRKAIVAPCIFICFALAGCGNNEFKGYACKENCEGHTAGYDWANKNNIDKEQDCLSSSQSFQEGCFAFVQEKKGDKLLPRTKNEVMVKYRSKNPVDVSNPLFVSFLPNDTTVKKVYYDATNKYLIVQLKNIYYHYCRVDATTWNNWKNATDADGFYKAEMQGNFDCRKGGEAVEY